MKSRPISRYLNMNCPAPMRCQAKLGRAQKCPMSGTWRREIYGEWKKLSRHSYIKGSGFGLAALHVFPCFVVFGMCSCVATCTWLSPPSVGLFGTIIWRCRLAWIEISRCPCNYGKTTGSTVHERFIEVPFRQVTHSVESHRSQQINGNVNILWALPLLETGIVHDVSCLVLTTWA